MESNLQSTMAQLLAEARKTSQTAITTPRFRIDLSRDQVYEMLKGFYINDVQDRNSGGFQDDEDTNKRLRMISGWLTSGKNRPSLLLYGGVGNGKTTMAHAIASTIDALRDSARKIEKSKAYGYTITPEQKEEYCLLTKFGTLPSPKIITAQKLAWMAKNDEETYRKVAEAKFLIIDDLGCEPVSVKNYGTEITPVTDIIYQRYETMSTTIVTTNLDKKDIRNLYGLRVSDRIEEAYDSIAFTKDSYRIKR